MTGIRLTTFSATIWLVMLLAASAGREYFVAGAGSDDASGISEEGAFRTLGKGLAALEAGDTLTILPGEYMGGGEREGLGNADVTTTIRALIPGSVIIRGDMPSPAFTKLDGARFTYVADSVDPVEQVLDRESGKSLRKRVSLEELEFLPGGFHQDLEAGKLYISNSGLHSAEGVEYSQAESAVSNGIHLIRPINVVIEGLAVTGFFSSASAKSGWGILIDGGVDCVVRNCMAFLNRGGIGIHSGDSSGGNSVEHCTAWRNGVNILALHGNNDLLRDNLAFSGAYGIRHYGGRRATRQERNVAWGNRVLDFQLKGVDYDNSWAVRNIALGNGKSKMLENSLIVGYNRHRSPEDTGPDTIRFMREADLDPDVEFADVWHLDFRLQSDSRFRGAVDGVADAGPQPHSDRVYFVSEKGDNAAAGRSIASAWRTLSHALANVQPDSVIYIQADEWVEPVTAEVAGGGLKLRGRGKEPVILSGAVELGIEGDLQLSNLLFRDGVTVRSKGAVEVSRSGFAGSPRGLNVVKAQSLKVTHCEFSGFSTAGIQIGEVADVFLAGNIFANSSSHAIILEQPVGRIFSDYNLFASPGKSWPQITNEGNHLSIGEDIERYSRESSFKLSSTAGFPRPSAQSPSGTGYLGNAHGIYAQNLPEFDGQTFVSPPVEINLAGPFLHSATKSTANIEWWASEPADYEVSWQRADGSGSPETVAIQAGRYVSFSMTRLDPETEYTLTVRTVRTEQSDSDDEDDNNGNSHVAAIEFTFPFATNSISHEGRDLYVSPTGSDSSTGDTPDAAWRSLNHAASLVRPGDTVWLKGGVYTEPFWIRVTGTKDDPIAFRAVPGERVQFDGKKRVMGAVVTATNKSGLIFDGFYIRDLTTGMETPFTGVRRAGAFLLHRVDDVTIERCFMDGSDPGYSPGVLAATHCRNLTIRNCVIIGAMGGGITFASCPELRIENNVFLRNMIGNIGEGVNAPGQNVYIRNNIFTDSIPSKQNTSIANIALIEPLQHDNNCYFLRDPETKTIAIFYHSEGYYRAAKAYRMEPGQFNNEPDELIRVTLRDLREIFKPDDTSFATDPEFRGAADIPEADNRGRPIFVPDRLISTPDLDFADLFSTNSEVTARRIGLLPEAFERHGSHLPNE